jgi:Fe-S cluster biosynthesis and repair protein YggX
MAPAETAGRTVFCAKLKQELPGLDAPPWPGALGQRIYEHISREAWELWEERMKMILNEYRLLPFQKEAQQLIATQMEDFLFGEGGATPPDYTPGH